MIGSRWFQKSTNTPTGVSQNERFAEHLDNRLGLFLTKLAERVTALEQAAKPTQPSSMGRTATGVAAMNANWRPPKYNASTTLMHEFVSVVSAVLNGTAAKATLTKGGYRITVERESSSLTGGL